MLGFRGEPPNRAEKKSHSQPWLVRQQLHVAKQRTDCLGNFNSTAQHSCDVMCDNLQQPFPPTPDRLGSAVDPLSPLNVHSVIKIAKSTLNSEVVHHKHKT